jgi:hypothetical protein
MTLTLTLTADVEAKLRERAAENGQPPDVYASRVLAEAIASPMIDELLAPVRKEVADSGMTEAQLMDLGRELLEKVRAER